MVISKIPLSRGTNRQNKHRKTNLNNMAVISRVLILFSSLLTALISTLVKLLLLTDTAITTQTGDGKPVK